MFDLTPIYEPKTEQFVCAGLSGKRNAYDTITQRMMAPLSAHEMSAVLNMIKRRAMHLGQELWIATGIFLATMGIEELGDLRRCDFARAVEYFVTPIVLDQMHNAM